MLNFAACLLREYRNADNTVDNMLHTIKHRVYIDPPGWNPVRQLQRVMWTAAKRMGRGMRAPLSRTEVFEELKKFPSGKRKLYGDALLASDPQPWATAGVKAFIKDEWTPKKVGKTWRSRVIQFREPGYLAHALHFGKVLEHSFYKGQFLFNRKQKYTCAKGFNPHDRAVLLEKLVSELSSPCSIALDGSAFDAHVVVQALKLEWKFYQIAAREAGWDENVVRLMRQYARSQESNKVRARCKDGKVSYRVDGNRMSGDWNTGLGNSVLQSMFLTAALANIGVPESDYRFLVDGDDAVLLVESHWRDACIAGLPGIFRGFSQELRVEGGTNVSVDNLEPIEFCQAHPVRVHGHWRMIRDPYKVVNCYLRTYRWSQTWPLMQRYFATISPPEMIINTDVPILDRFFEVLNEFGGSAKPLDSIARNFWRRTITSVPYARVGVDHPTRCSFEKAFGISAQDQMYFEQLLDTRRGKFSYSLDQL